MVFTAGWGMEGFFSNWKVTFYIFQNSSPKCEGQVQNVAVGDCVDAKTRLPGTHLFSSLTCSEALHFTFPVFAVETIIVTSLEGDFEV